MAPRIGNRGKQSDAAKAKKKEKNDAKRATKQQQQQQQEDEESEPRAKRPKLVHDDDVGMSSAPGHAAPSSPGLGPGFLFGASSPGFVFGSPSGPNPPGLGAHFEELANEQSRPSGFVFGAGSPSGFVFGPGPDEELAEEQNPPPSPVLRDDSPPAAGPQIEDDSAQQTPPVPPPSRSLAWQQILDLADEQNRRRVQYKIEQGMMADPSGPQIDQRTGLAVTPTRSPATTGGVGLGVVPHDLSGQPASTSGLVIPRTNGYAGSSDPHHVDALLVAEGWRPFAQMTNEWVLEQLGEHSADGHLLAGYMDPIRRRAMEAKIGAARCPVDPEMGCEPSSLSKIAPLMGYCGCGTYLTGIQVPPSRVVATLNERIEHAWMAVVNKRISQAGARQIMPIFEESGRCDKWQRAKHCLNKDHVFLETNRQNQARRGHHIGEHGCFCELPCMGEKVVHKLTWKDTGAGR
jgi:hypothetical protein